MDDIKKMFDMMPKDGIGPVLDRASAFRLGMIGRMLPMSGDA